jgi:hypothetical protein
MRPSMIWTPAPRRYGTLQSIRASVWAHGAIFRSLCCSKRNTWIGRPQLRVDPRNGGHLLAAGAREDPRNPIDEDTELRT